MDFGYTKYSAGTTLHIDFTTGATIFETNKEELVDALKIGAKEYSPSSRPTSTSRPSASSSGL